MGELAALAAAFLWSATSTLLAGLVVRVPAPVLSFVRLALAIPLYVVLIFATGAHESVGEANWRTIVSMLGSGMIGFGLGDSLYILGLSRLGISRTFPVTQALFTLFTFLGAAMLLGESIGWNVAGGSALILGGVYLVVTGKRPAVPVPEERTADPGERPIAPRPLPAPAAGSAVAVAMLPDAEIALAPSAGRTSQLLASLPAYSAWAAVIAASIAWAGATLWLRAGSGELDALAAGGLRVPAGALALGFFVGSQYGFRSLEVFRDRRMLVAVIAAGWLGSVIGGSLYVYSVQEAGAAKAAILSATSPLLALPLAIMFLGERPSRTLLAGTILTVIGVALVV